jgi:integrase
MRKTRSLSPARKQAVFRQLEASAGRDEIATSLVAADNPRASRLLDIDFDRRVLTVQRSKNGETRHVPLNDAAIVVLRTAEAYKNGSPHVFLAGNGTRLCSPRFWFDAAVEAAGLKNFTWHCLRHTFASRLVMAGVDLRTVQELMGHKTIQMTVRYAHLAPQHRLAAVQRLCDTETVQKAASDTRTDTRSGVNVKEEGTAPPQPVVHPIVI